MAFASNSHIDIVQCTNPVKVWLITEEQRELRKSRGGKFVPGDYIYVGCGHCPCCAKKKTNDWLFRLKAEAKNSSDLSFITLTYDKEHYPAPKGNGKREFQLFMKRVRKLYSQFASSNFKYYCISETGGKFGRLHHHAIFFNTNTDRRELRYIVRDCWKNGLTDVKSVHQNHIHYVAKAHMQQYSVPTQYVISGVKNTKAFKKINYFWMTCSKGIGASLLTDDYIKYIFDRGDGCVMTGRNKDGSAIISALPSYYINKLQKYNLEKYNAIKAIRLSNAIETTRYTEQVTMSPVAIEQIELVNTETGEVVTEFRAQEKKEVQLLKDKERRILKNSKKYNFLRPPTEEELKRWMQRNQHR